MRGGRGLDRQRGPVPTAWRADRALGESSPDPGAQAHCTGPRFPERDGWGGGHQKGVGGLGSRNRRSRWVQPWVYPC